MISSLEEKKEELIGLEVSNKAQFQKLQKITRDDQLENRGSSTRAGYVKIPSQKS
jgi:hypothetical protein